MLKKTIFTLNVGGYSPEITKRTYPHIKAYADKIGAHFVVIEDRKYPNFPVVYEKLQIYDLGAYMGNDWNIYVDSDTLIHPDTPDFTVLLNKDTFIHNGADFAPIRWTYDHYFLRDGRNIGSCNWFTAASDWCLDLWHPLDDIGLEEALKRIHPTSDELKTVITKDHLIDDYVLSRNIARYGLKFDTLAHLWEKWGNPGDFFWHQYQITTEDKIVEMDKVLELWSKTHAQIEKEKNAKPQENV